MASVSSFARLQSLLVADSFPNVGTGIAVLCSTRQNFFRLRRAMTVPPAPVSTSNEALTRLTSTSMTRRFGSLSKFARLRITIPKPSCFKKLFSVVGLVAVFPVRKVRECHQRGCKKWRWRNKRFLRYSTGSWREHSRWWQWLRNPELQPCDNMDGVPSRLRHLQIQRKERSKELAVGRSGSVKRAVKSSTKKH